MTTFERELEDLERERQAVMKKQQDLHRVRGGIEDADMPEVEKEPELKGIHRELELLETHRQEIQERMRDLHGQRRQVEEKEEKELAARRNQEGRSLQRTTAGVAKKATKAHG